MCIGTRDYQILECKIAAGDNCQSLLDKKEKLAQSCDECIPTVYGGLIDTCEGKKKSRRTAAEFEVQCATPLRQLDEEYSKCRQIYAWKATGKGSCSVEGMVCSPETTAGRRFDVCRPGPDAYKDTGDQQDKSAEQPKTTKTQNVTPEFILVNNLSFDAIAVTFLNESNDFGQSQDGADSGDRGIPQDIKELFEKFKPITNEEFQKLLDSKPDDLAADEERIVDIGSIGGGQGSTKVYWFGNEGGAVMNASSWEDIKFKEPVKDSNTQEILRMVEIDQGQLEVKLKEPDGHKFGAQGDFFDLFVVQTHFLVNISQDKKSALIAVYEGEVEVKTKDGKTIKVKPDGDPSTGSGQGKPGVVVISQKLSPIKLALVGLILAGVIGGAIFFLKRKKKR